MAQEDVDNAQKAYEAFGRGDLQAASENMSDDVQWWTSPELPQGGTTRGKDALIENWSNIPNYWVEFAVTPSEFVDGGDKVIVIGTQTGKAKDSGNSFESPFVHILWSSGGQVSRSEFHSDSAAGLKALG